MARALAEGLYEHVITQALDAALRADDATHDIGPIDPADGPATFARHVAREVERVLASVGGDDRVGAQATLANELLARLLELAPKHAAAEAALAPPPRRLDAIHRTAPLVRPATPLASSTLLTRNRTEPALGHELAREIASADRIDIIIAFVSVGGVRAIRDALESFCQRGTGERLRLLTTTFGGITEVAALDALARLPGVSVKVSYDVRRTRLHAKAWLFRRLTGLDTAYVGSANLTNTALGSGHEWMVKICGADLPHVIEKFQGTFDSLWFDPEFEPYDPTSNECRERLRAALAAERSTSDATTTILFTLRPFPFQEEILDRLEAERTVHARTRNLVVAATGTGKTVIAAFDYKRQRDRAGLAPKLLFLAHRRELLEQARMTFRHVLGEGAFGELLAQGEEPTQWNHVFATIQSAVARDILKRFGAEHFRYVVLDECHHAPADSYQELVPKLRPEIMLGLTATPERMDGKSLLPDFDGHLAAELRLWHALERQLLVPFEYYGVSDNTDLSRVRWSRTGYDAAELSQLYTGNDARVDLVIEQLRKRVSDVRSVRALAFCVSIEHAEFMARALTKRGIPALAVHGDTRVDVRAAAPRQLRERAVNVLVTCDLYNEGVDLPFVDVLLFLRPTASATLFVQQLGRGLRQDDGKTSCLVLDFIGTHRKEFRFDATFSAFTGIARAKLAKAAHEGFPFLPSGCVLQLDSVARETVLASLRDTLASARKLIAEVKELAQTEPTLTLGRYLDETGREPSDVYKAGGWTVLCEGAGLIGALDDETRDWSRRLGWLLHVDEPTRLRTWASAVVEPESPPAERTDLYRRRVAMLDFQLEHRGVLPLAEDTVRAYGARVAIREELKQLVDVLGDRTPLANDVFPVAEWPLALHRHYERREIMAAVGYVTPGEKKTIPQGGIVKLESDRELLLVTLDKSARSFSPTTRYRDYAISRSLFHWETQSAASVSRDSGKRYIESPSNGWSFYLFARSDQDGAYSFLGRARYVRHEGDRPIAITWALDAEIPAILFQEYATLTQG